ncbi:MAG: hypothetical protein R3237_05485 [Nitrosopumilaceae archaeon]|nr:hypothetical protein [Nitrosopumilaceae archaeon]
MPRDEILVPKELREFMLEKAEETFLGQKNGAKKQYRYGNLHIREYEDKFLVHTDRIDPRKDPIGHLMIDAPEVLVGIACAIFSGSLIRKSSLGQKSKRSPIFPELASSIISGYLGYKTAQKIKEKLE